jgi:glycosyltransferase involved in cell wall biosynthesis
MTAPDDQLLRAPVIGNVPRVIVSQLGARQHYEVAMLCHSSNALVRLHTDAANVIPAAVRKAIPISGLGAMRRLLGRTIDLPQSKLQTYPMAAAYWHLRLRAAKADRKAAYDLYLRQGQAFAQNVARSLAKEDFTTFFGFSSACLETLEEAKALGRLAVVDEIAPTHLEDDIIATEHSRFQGWEPSFARTPESFLRRIEAEWAAADRILVNSQWSCDALKASGAEGRKIHVVPIGYSPPRLSAAPKQRAPGEPLRVLWLGTLNLRKGIPYALEAARMLEGAPVQFTFAGPIAIDLERAAPLPRNSKFVGQVPRANTEQLWQDHHVFLLPTLSDGFAITQIEAMAHGLPVIVTPCCGLVVSDGVDGRVIPARDADAIAKALKAFLDTEMDLTATSNAALRTAARFSPKAVWPRLRAVLTPPVASAERNVGST